MLKGLKAAKILRLESIEKAVTIIQTRKYKGPDNMMFCVRIQMMLYSSDVAKLEVDRGNDGVHLFCHRHMTVKNHSEVANIWRWFIMLWPTLSARFGSF